MKDLTLEFACRQIAELFSAHAEWLFVPSEGGAQSLRRDELEIAIAHGKLVFSCWTETGNRCWHVLAWHWNGQLLEFETSRRLGRERVLMQLVPRASAFGRPITVPSRSSSNPATQPAKPSNWP